METRRLGRSNVECPVVIFGAWAIGGWYWGGTDDDKAVEAIHRALDAGMIAIDTAPAYGRGHSETVVGRALRDRRDRALIFTKCGLRWDDDRGRFFFDMVDPDGSKHPLYRNLRPDSVRHECERSLERLGVETIDLFQCHWPDPTTPVAETMGELARLHLEGKIRAIGVSNFTPDMMREAQAALGDIPLASDQPKYNLLDRDIEKDVLPHVRHNDIGAIVYSPLEQGLLTGKVTEDRTFADGDLRADRPLFRVANRRRINAAVRDTLAAVGETHGATPTQVAIAWTVHQPGVTAAIVGARNVDQVEENAAAGGLELAPGELEAIGKRFAELELART